MSDISQEYRTALERYLNPLPAYGQGAMESLDRRLEVLEWHLASTPPKYKDSNGIMLPRAKGLITADEARAGATPEGLRALEDLTMPRGPRIRDDFKLIPTREWSDAIQQKKQDDARLRPFVEDLTFDQNGYGSCASEGIGGCTVTCEQVQNNEVVEKLNCFRLYKRTNGGRDGGSSLSDNLSAAKRYGIPTEQVSPRSRGWRSAFTDGELEDGLRHRPIEVWRVSDKEEYGTALLLGMPVYSGYSGHAWYGVDLLDTTRFVWHNSWGADWADHGFSTLKFTQIMWGYGCWAVRTAVRPTV